MEIRGTIYGNSCSQKTTPSVLSDINEGDLRAIKEFLRKMRDNCFHFSPSTNSVGVRPVIFWKLRQAVERWR